MPNSENRPLPFLLAMIVAVVELEEQEGLRLTTNIVNCGVDDLRFDIPVQVVFEQVEDVFLPLFAPLGA